MVVWVVKEFISDEENPDIYIYASEQTANQHKEISMFYAYIYKAYIRTNLPDHFKSYNMKEV